MSNIPSILLSESTTMRQTKATWTDNHESFLDQFILYLLEIKNYNRKYITESNKHFKYVNPFNPQTDAMR